MAYTYTYTNVIDSAQGLAHGGTSNVKKLRELVNRAVREVFSSVDLRSAKRRAQMSPFIAQEQYRYTKPSDMKGLGVVDIAPQIGRTEGFRGEFFLTSPENFDRYKRSYRNVIAIDNHDNVGSLMVSAVLDSKVQTVHEFDSLTSNGVVSGALAANNLTIDNNLYFHGNGSVNFDVDTSGATAEIVITGMTALDLTKYESQSQFLYLWIPSGSQSSVSSITLHWGDDSDNHYIRTVTATNEGLAFQAGLNLLRFDWDSSITTDGAPTITSVDFAKVTVTLSAALGSQATDWRIDYLVARRGVPHDVVYYTKFGWTNSSGTYIENSTADTDLIVADTDELDLILARIDYLLARANRAKQNEINEAKDSWLRAKEDYQTRNPSEAKVLTESYYELSSVGDDRDLGSTFDRDTT